MSHITRKLLLTGLSLVLFGGTISPVLAQADSAETPSTTTNDSGSTAPTTYKLSSVEMPYTEYITGTQIQKHYWFSFPGINNSYTTDEITGTTEGGTWWETNLAPHLSADEQHQLQPSAGNVYTIATGISLDSPTETLGNFSFHGTDFYFTLLSWLLKSDAQFKLGTLNLKEAQDYYEKNLQSQMISLGGSDPFMGAFDSQNSFETTVIPMASLYSKSLVYVDDTTADFPQKFSKLNLSETIKANQNLRDNVQVKDLITSTTSDNNTISYSSDGLLVSAQSSQLPILVFDVPAVSTVPEPTSKPVTVHYVDDQGTTLKPDKTLTGSLGDTYKTEPLTIAGYTLAKTTGTAAGTFSNTTQSVTYTYTKNAVKATVLSATKKIGLYSSPDFSSKTLKQWYAKKSRLNRPMFEVIGTAISKTGVKRYQVKDVNSGSDTFGQTGYITANTDYTTSAYYTPTYKQITVISPEGVNAYNQRDLTHQKTHYKQGQVLTIKKIVAQNMTTRFLLKNGTYITANKKLVTAGKQTMPQRVQAKIALNRYSTANLTKRNHHYTKKAHATFTVKGWAYSNANDFSKGDTLRYKVAGGYITANKHLVRTID